MHSDWPKPATCSVSLLRSDKGQQTQGWSGANGPSSEVAFSECGVGSVEKLGDPAFGLSHFLQSLPHLPKFRGLRLQKCFQLLFQGIGVVVSEVTRKLLQQAWGKTRRGIGVAGCALFRRDVQCNAEGVDGPCLRVLDLAGFDLRDARFRQAGFLGEAVLRQPLDAPLLVAPAAPSFDQQQLSAMCLISTRCGKASMELLPVSLPFKSNYRAAPTG